MAGMRSLIASPTEELLKVSDFGIMLRTPFIDGKQGEHIVDVIHKHD
jgi:hypothetical protein